MLVAAEHGVAAVDAVVDYFVAVAALDIDDCLVVVAVVAVDFDVVDYLVVVAVEVAMVVVAVNLISCSSMHSAAARPL